MADRRPGNPRRTPPVALTIRERFDPRRFRDGETNPTQPVVLTHRRIFILPTAHGLACAVLLGGMLVAATVYGNNLGFVLTFLLAAIVLVSALHSFRNLAGLRFATRPCRPVFAGETAQLTCVVENPSAMPRPAIRLNIRGARAVCVDLEPASSCPVVLPVCTRQRGWQPIGTVTVCSLFPLGLFRAWSPIAVDDKILVYPAPAGNSLPLPAGPAGAAGNGRRVAGGEDFAGFRPYQPGDSTRHLHWPALAKGQGLHTRHYHTEQAGTLELHWLRTPEQETEARLSRLCRWALDADAAGLAYSLVLPGGRIGTGSGGAHLARCLKALALDGRDHAPD